MEKTILIIDDNEDIRKCMTFFLEACGYAAYEAANGKEAIEAAKKYHPDLIFMDISMPVMDGLEATRIIRQSGNNISNIPIIAFTAFGENYYERAIIAGCNALLSKPIDFDELTLVIEKYIVREVVDTCSN